MGGLLAKSFLIGSGFALGLIASIALAVTVGTVKTWTTGETLTAADLNTTITSLKTALEAIPNWTKSGTSAVYTDGNVGIGTTSPGSPLPSNINMGKMLEIKSIDTANGNGAGLLLSRSDAGTGLGIYDYNNGNTYIDSMYNGVNGKMNFRLMTNGTPVNALTLDGTGKVGIGTTTPLYLLHVVGDAGSAAANTAFINTNANGYGVYIQSASTANDKYALNVTGNAGATAGLYVSNAGNVGIGTQTLGYPLTMGSGAYVTTGGVWTNASSREYKENLRDLSADEALAAVMALAPQKFNYRAERGNCLSDRAAKAAPTRGEVAEATTESGRPRSPLRGEERADPRRGRLPTPPKLLRRLDADPSSSCSPDQYVGFIAEDVPALVATNDRKGLSSMDLVAVLTKVVQEQQSRIEKLENEIASRSLP